MPDLDRGVALILLGGVVLALGIHGAIRALIASRWSTVAGTIVESQTVNSGTSFVPNWEAQVRYQYVVGNVTREGNRVGIRRVGDGSWRWLAEQEASRYPQDAKVKVYVSPDDPAVTLLEPEKNIAIYGELIIGSLCMWLGVYDLVT